MKFRWTEEAAGDLETIANYLFERTPGRAADIFREVYQAPEALLTFPYRGRIGKSLELANSCSQHSPTSSCIRFRIT
jgi:plasmid stabilization system protein ParE